ncbi:MAG: galactokinase [Planctomycetota bacterium]
MREGNAVQEASFRVESLREHRRRFQERFGNATGDRLFFSPGRVNLMGAHLDYNGGPVMPMAIDRGTFFAVRPRADREVRLASTLESSELNLSLERLPQAASGSWHDYPAGVLRDLLPLAAEPSGLDVLVGGDLPIGAGLSSSASICVGMAHVLNRVWGLGLSMERCVEAALWAEREFVGVRCGIMDPYAVGFARPGHLLWLDCKDASTSLLPLDTNEVSIAVADTGIRRELAQGAFNQRVEECAQAFAHLRGYAPGAVCLRDVPQEVVEQHASELAPAVARRARHVAGEVARTFAARDALLRGDVASFGRAITEAHFSLRDLFEVSVPELDCLVEASLEHEGVLGTRLTGAGFGGCTVLLLRTEAAGGLAEHLTEAFRARFGREPAVSIFGGDGGPRELPDGSPPQA